MSITSIYEASRRSLTNQQSAINVTAQNITNANNDNYSRRKINFTFSSKGLGGQDVERVHDKFLENQIRTENQEFGRADVQKSLFKNVEIYFGEPGDGSLTNVMQKFWNSWEELSNDPESEIQRLLVSNSGKNLTDTFNKISNSMESLSNETISMAQDKIIKINGIVEQLGTLQRTVNRSSDIMDTEDRLIDELSKLINLQIREDENGRKSIRSGGYSLVNGTDTTTFKVGSQQTDGLPTIVIKTERDDIVNINSGELGGILEFNNSYLKSYKSQLDSVASTIVSWVNTEHKAGYGINNITGKTFFDESSTTAKTMKLSGDILADSSLIATSSAANTIGDGTVAQTIADLSAKLDSDTNKSIDDSYQILITTISTDGNREEFISTNQEKIVSQLRGQKASYSGVSLDEEMTNLLKFERAYQAAAKVAQTVDEIMKTILQMV